MKSMTLSEKNMLYTMIIFAALLVVVVCAVTLYIYLNVFHNKKRPVITDPYAGLASEFLEGMRDVIRIQIDDLSAYPCEEIRVPSYDGLSLHARFYAADEKKPVAILMHGYKGSSYTELSGAALMMLSHGLSVIVADERSHGQSEGGTITFGIKERHDCVSWVEYVKARFGENRAVVLYGISMGAASVLMASELLSRDSVKAIVADCPYSSPEGIIKRVMKNRGLPPRAVYPAVVLSALVWGRFRLGASRPDKAVKNTDIPILLIHGENDNFVPPSMSEDIKRAAASECILASVEGAAHGQCFAVWGEEYVKTVLSFIDSHTNN